MFDKIKKLFRKEKPATTNVLELVKPVKRRNPDTPSMGSLMNRRGRLVKSSGAKLPFGSPELRGALMAMRKLENKFQRLYRNAQRRATKIVEAEVKCYDPASLAKLGVDVEAVKRARIRVLMEKMNLTQRERLMKKAMVLQAKIKKYTPAMIEERRMAA